MAQRQAGCFAVSSAGTRRQCGVDRRGDQKSAAATPGLAPAGHRRRHCIGPNPNHHGQPRRRALHASVDDRARRWRHRALPAQALGDRHPVNFAADIDHRNFRGDVRPGLQPRQSVVDGAHDRGGLRRRRRHRHGREHCAAYRRRRLAAAGRARRRRRDRLHDPVDLDFAGRGLHSALPDGRRRRTPVSRIRCYGRRLDSGLGARLADAHSDALRKIAPGAGAMRRRAGFRARSKPSSPGSSPSTIAL